MPNPILLVDFCLRLLYVSATGRESIPNLLAQTKPKGN